MLVLLWLAFAHVLLPVRARDVYMLVLSEGDGTELEQQCRAWLLLKNAGILERPLVIVDNGLNEDGKRLAQTLTKLDSAIVFCDPDEILRLIHIGA